MESTTRTNLKKAFNGYKGLTKKLEKDLKKLNIDVIRSKNHIILRYKALDGSLQQSVMSKTGSDSPCAGLNLACDIARKMGA